MIAITVTAVIREERVWLQSAHGEAYRAYRSRTGMFIPFVGERLADSCRDPVKECDPVKTCRPVKKCRPVGIAPSRHPSL